MDNIQEQVLHMDRVLDNLAIQLLTLAMLNYTPQANGLSLSLYCKNKLLSAPSYTSDK